VAPSTRDVTALAPASAAEFYDPLPCKRLKEDSGSEATNPGKDEMVTDFSSDLQTKKEPKAVTNIKEEVITNVKDEVNIKSEETSEIKPINFEEDHPSIDNPRLFTELLEHEAAFIGDIERTFATFEQLENKTKQKEADEKHLEFMKRLDTWGVPNTNPQYPFTGFYGDNSNIEDEELDIPGDWKDEELFSELDVRCKTESVFFNCWLPKFALKVRRDPYRNLLRTINKKDPEFNIVW